MNNKEHPTNKYKAIEEALRTIHEFCVGEIEKERDLNNPEDYMVHKTLCDGISGVIGIKSYIDYIIVHSEDKEITKDKPVIKNNINVNRTIN